MSSSINMVVVTGNLTRPPEIRRTQGGMAVLNLGIAVNDRRKNSQTGQWEDYPNFIDCTMFGERAEKVAQYLDKGSKVAIQGKLRYSSWERDGQKRSKVEVAIDEIEFLSQRTQQSAPQYQQQSFSRPQPAPQYQPQQYAPQQYQQPAPIPAQQQVEAPIAYEDIPF